MHTTLCDADVCVRDRDRSWCVRVSTHCITTNSTSDSISQQGRTGGDSPIKKDLDIVRKLVLGARGSAELEKALSQDCQFLARHNVMDYSLLVAVCPEQGEQHHCTW